jgi:hypothetical protein
MLFYSILASIVLAVTFFHSPSAALYFTRYKEFIAFTVIFTISKIMFIIISYMYPLNSLARIAASLLKIFGIFTFPVSQFLFSITLSGTLNLIVACIQYLFIVLAFIISPTVFYSNLVNYYEKVKNSAFSSKINFNIYKKIVFLDGSEIDYRWNYLFLFLSLSSLFFVSFCIFSSFINTRFSVENSKKKQIEKDEISLYDRIVSKIYMNRRNYLIKGFALVLAVMVGLIALKVFMNQSEWMMSTSFTE